MNPDESRERRLPEEWEIGQSLVSKRRYFSPYEALMSAPPGYEPEISQLEILHLRDIINDAIEGTLTPLELWVFNALVVERKSLRSLGHQIGRPKTTVARIRDNAIKKVRQGLKEHPAIIDYLENQ